MARQGVTRYYERISAECDKIGCGSIDLSSMSITSGAGHDANSFAPVCPGGMVFVPSVGGFSHSPNEYTEWEDCVNGANVLLQTALRFSHGE